MDNVYYLQAEFLTSGITPQSFTKKNDHSHMFSTALERRCCTGRSTFHFLRCNRHSYLGTVYIFCEGAVVRTLLIFEQIIKPTLAGILGICLSRDSAGSFYDCTVLIEIAVIRFFFVTLCGLDRLPALGAGKWIKMPTATTTPHSCHAVRAFIIAKNLAGDSGRTTTIPTKQTVCDHTTSQSVSGLL